MIIILITFISFRKMYRCTIELDDEDTINEHRRYSVVNPDHAREKAEDAAADDNKTDAN